MHVFGRQRHLRAGVWSAAFAIAFVVTAFSAHAAVTTATYTETFSTTGRRDATTTAEWDDGVVALRSGTNWNDVAALASQDISAVAYSPAFVSDRVMVVGNATGIVRSADAGVTWTTVATTGRPVTAIALSDAFGTDGVGFAMTNGAGLWRTLDHGASWAKIHASVHGFGIAVSPNFTSDRVVFAAALDRILRSADGGATWTAVNTGIDGETLLNGDIRGIAVSREYATDRTVYVGTLGQGLYRSTDGAETWTLVNPTVIAVPFTSALATDTGGIIVATFLDETFRSTDRGATWAKISSAPVEALAVDPASDAVLFATEQGVARWNGSFATYGSGWPGGPAQAIAVAPTFPTDRSVLVGRADGASVIRTGYASSGVAVSTAVDATAAQITRATLTADANAPSGTSIAYHLSVADGAPFWEGPVTPGAPWVFQRSGATLRWRATLASSSLSATPTIIELTLQYDVDDALAAPTAGSATPKATSVQWQFADRALDETGFALRDAASTLVTLSEANATAIDELGLTPNTTYCNRRVVALRGTTASAPSAIFPCTTTLSRTPAAPRVVGATSSVIVLSFTAHAENPPDTLYAIRETTTGQYVRYQSTAEVWKTHGEWNGSVEVRGLSPGTTYTFCLRARNRDGVETPCAPLVSAATTAAAILRGDASATLDAPLTGAVVQPGDDIRIAITVRHSGAGTARDVSVTIPLPAAVRPVSGALRIDGASQTDLQDGDVADIGGSTPNAITFALGNISNGATRTLVARVTVAPDAPTGPFTIAPTLLYRPHPSLDRRTVALFASTLTVAAASPLTVFVPLGTPLALPTPSGTPTALPAPSGTSAIVSPGVGGSPPTVPDAGDIRTGEAIVIAIPEHDAATNATPLVIRGQATPGSPVVILLDGRPLGTATPDADGSFTFTIPSALAEGTHTLSVSAGGAAPATSTFRVDRTAPSPPILESVRTVQRRPSVTPKTFDTTIEIRGRVIESELPELDAVLATVASDPVTFTIPLPDARWRFETTLPLTIGSHTVRIAARDRAGNRSAEAPEATFEVPPPACADDRDNDGDGAADFPNDSDCVDANDDGEGAEDLVSRLVGGIRDAALTSAGAVATAALAVADASGRVADAVGRAMDDPRVEQVAAVAAPVVVAAVAVATATAAQGVPLLAFLRYLFGLLSPAQLLGKRRRAAWGTVYASLAKRPVDLAVVRLVDAATGVVVQPVVTDAVGRYHFLIRRPGTYRITVQHPRYTFPSQYLRGKTDDGTFSNLYTGDTIAVASEGDVIARNIPVDAVEREVAPAQVIWNRRLAVMSSAVSNVGLLASVIAFAITPRASLGVMVAVNLALFAFFRRITVAARHQKSWGSIRDAATRAPIRHAIVRLFDQEFNKLLETVATDGLGRYRFLAGRSIFYVTAERMGYATAKSSPLDLRTREGIIRTDLALTPQ